MKSKKMSQNATNEAAIPNPLLEPFQVFVGEWNTIATHRLLPDTTLHGAVSFAWLQRGAFVMMQTQTVETGFPTNICIFGSDATGGYTMLYFDERGISRIFEATLQDNVWKLWITAPGFSQRFTGILADNGDTIDGVWELSGDDSTWKRTVALKYTRVK
jgi:hypothetical protein